MNRLENFRKKWIMEICNFPKFSDGLGKMMELEGLNEAARLMLGQRIERARHNKRLTLADLANRAGYDERTIRNVIKGQKTRVGTIEDICKVLEISVTERSNDTADEAHGRYTYNLYHEYIGLYYACRRSFSFPGSLLQSVYEIRWNKELGCLFFEETQRYRATFVRDIQDYSQCGEIFISGRIGLLHLVTMAEGAVRLVTLSKLGLDGTMKGIVLTQAPGPFYWHPSVSPILFRKADPALSAEELHKAIGPIPPDSAEYQDLNQSLIDIEQNVGKFATESLVANSQVYKNPSSLALKK
jgi:transcriptional regulator with XRE-family HTH domain